MNNKINIDSKFQSLLEIISEEYFHDLFAELIESSQFLDEQKQIELLEILAERFQKFYNVAELTENEKKFISDQLIKWTHFSNLNRVYELVGLMFSFVDKRYCEFLRLSLKTEQLTLDVRMEIAESIKEFEKEYFK
ncbi:hypothetical protein [Flavobacterium sp. RSSB_23]|uniref:hypothetical protein n=1 Tax=Flavobacterium sp. RSSB_23 TaxID=3447668 RepID=UPI003F2F2989